MTLAPLLTALLLVGDGAAQDTRALEAARIQALDNHLARLAGWGAASVVGGAAVAAVGQATADPVLRGIGTQSAAWGAINLAICGGAALFPAQQSGDRAQAFADEDALGDLLWLNLGLDVGYVMAGGALVLTSLLLPARATTPLGPLEASAEARGHGIGVMLQGAGLFVLDAVALGGHDERERALAR